MSQLKPRLWSVGRWALWLAVGLVLVRGLATFLPSGPSRAPTSPPVSAEGGAGRTLDQEAANFAALFVREYLTVRPGDGQERQLRLQPFLSPSLDPAAGLSAWRMQTPQTVEESLPWQVEAAGSDRWAVTVVARVRQAGAGTSGDAPSDSSSYMAFRVPVAQAGGRYVVYALPDIVPLPWDEAAVSVPQEWPGAPVTEGVPDLRDVLTGFLKAYTAGTPAEIEYYTVPGARVEGLRGRFLFRSLTGYQVRRQGDRIWVVTDLVLEDPVSHAEFEQQWLLELSQKERWYVKEVARKGGTYR